MKLQSRQKDKKTMLNTENTIYIGIIEIGEAVYSVMYENETIPEADIMIYIMI